MWKNISKWREVEKVSGDFARDSFEYLRVRSAKNPSVATRNSNCSHTFSKSRKCCCSSTFQSWRVWQLISFRHGSEGRIDHHKQRSTCQVQEPFGVPVWTDLHVSSCNNLRGTAAKECKKMCIWRKCRKIWNKTTVHHSVPKSCRQSTVERQ